MDGPASPHAAYPFGAGVLRGVRAVGEEFGFGELRGKVDHVVARWELTRRGELRGWWWGAEVGGEGEIEEV